MRESFVFYRSFYEALAALNQTQRTKVLMALCEYALDGIEPDLTGAPAAVFMLIRPQVDANNRKYENGKKGGRPANSTSSENKKNQKITKRKPKDNQSKTKVEPNVNVNVNVNDNANVNATATANENASGSDVVSGGSSSNNNFDIWKRLTPDDIDAVYNAYPDSGGLLIDEVAAVVKKKRRKIKDPLAYILGYAEKVEWDDKADHFDGNLA